MKNNYFLRKLMVLGACLFLLSAVLKVAFADETARRIEEETREKLAVTEEVEPQSLDRWGFDFGGWINFLYINYNNDDNNDELKDEIDYATYFDVRPWAKVTYTEASLRQHSLYVRLKDLHSNLEPKETAGGSDHDGPHLDYAYGVFDFTPLWIKVGRQYFTVGQGLVYSDVNDGLEVTLVFPKSKIKGFYAHTLPHQENIDTSVPGHDKSSERNFYGAEYEYVITTGHTIYGFGVVQQDASDEHPLDPQHDFSYDSQYLGAGARGNFPCHVSYWVEGVKESGRSFIYTTNSKEDIDAWAGIFAVSYNPDTYGHPSIYFKYAYGSGDKDRASVTDTVDGNTSGRDRNFLYFGYIPTGYAFASRLSNLYFYKTGFTLKPLEQMRLFRGCTLGVDYYKYYKAKKTGGLYDIDAVGMDRDIGYEVDATLILQIFSDLSCVFQYGYFQPGKAYPAGSNDSEKFLSLSTSLLF